MAADRENFQVSCTALDKTFDENYKIIINKNNNTTYVEVSTVDVAVIVNERNIITII